MGAARLPTCRYKVYTCTFRSVGTNTDRTVYGAASASASSFVVHHTQQISKAAVAGDAENINKQARKERTDWINKQKNKQATNGSCPRPQWGVPAPPSSANGPLHPSRADHVVPQSQKQKQL